MHDKLIIFYIFMFHIFYIFMFHYVRSYLLVWKSLSEKQKEVMH